METTTRSRGRIDTLLRRLFAAAMGMLCASLAPGALAEAPVTDLSTVDVTLIEPGDIGAALALSGGTPIQPEDRPRVRLPVSFEFNSARLGSGAEALLDKVAKALSSEELASFGFSIEGHTDSLGPEEYNSDLSNRRAEAVKGHLIARGVEEARLVSIGRGELSPVDSNDTHAGRQHNRRVEIVNMGSESQGSSPPES